MTDEELGRAICAKMTKWDWISFNFCGSPIRAALGAAAREVLAEAAAPGTSTLPPEPPPGFVRARFPIAVGGDGKWAVQGGNGETDRAMVEATDWFAREGYPSRVSFIVVDAPTPEAAPVIVGVVAP